MGSTIGMTKLTSKEEFFIHYEAIMPKVLSISKNKVANQIMVLKKLYIIKHSEPVLELLLKNLGKYKLKAAAYIVPIEANLVKPNMAEASRLQAKITAMLENITNTKDLFDD